MALRIRWATLRPIDNNTRQQLNQHLVLVEDVLTADAIAIVSPIVSGLDGQVKRAIGQFTRRRTRLAVTLDAGRYCGSGRTNGQHDSTPLR